MSVTGGADLEETDFFWDEEEEEAIGTLTSLTALVLTGGGLPASLSCLTNLKALSTVAFSGYACLPLVDALPHLAKLTSLVGAPLGRRAAHACSGCIPGKPTALLTALSCRL